MVRPTRTLLSGILEVEECYVGGYEAQVISRGSEKKALVILAVEITDSKIGRIRMRLIENASSDCLLSFIKESIEQGSTINTDGWAGYAKVAGSGYKHIVTPSKAEALPHVHLIISLLKRWILGTHQGAVSNEYLLYYLDEFTFRFNRRRSKNRGLLFQRLIENGVLISPVTIAALKPKQK
jgi:transposase-like protein